MPKKNETDKHVMDQIIANLPGKDLPVKQNIDSLDDYIAAYRTIKGMKKYHEELARKMEQGEDNHDVTEITSWEEHMQALQKRIEAYRKNLLVFPSEHLSKNVEYLLKREKMKNSELESLLGVSAGYISRAIGVDSKKRLSVDIVWMIAELFHVNIDDLLNRDLVISAKDLGRVVDFINKIKKETDEGTIHWEKMGTRRQTRCHYLFQSTPDGRMIFAPNGEVDQFHHLLNSWTTEISIGKIYFVEVRNTFRDTDYILYLDNVEEYLALGGSGEEGEPMILLVDSEEDATDLLAAEMKKLKNTIQTHEDDYTVPKNIRYLINQYLNGENSENVDDDLPF